MPLGAESETGHWSPPDPTRQRLDPGAPAPSSSHTGSRACITWYAKSITSPRVTQEGGSPALGRGY